MDYSKNAKPNLSASARRRVGGFTLIEVLVTTVILAIGLLGLAALQSNGLRETHNTYFRTQANLLAGGLADRMRANRQGAKDANYAFTGGTAPTDPGCGSATSSCSAADIASSDLSEWVAWVNNTLPAGDAVVTASTAAVPYHVITLLWDERRDGATGTGCDPTDTADKACLTLRAEIDNDA